MGLLAELAVNLVTNTKKFTSDFQKNTKAVKGFQGATKALTSTMGMLGVAVSGIGIVAFANQQRKMIDELGKGARRLGLTTEAFGAYSFAADLSNITTEQLSTGLERMQQTIGRALLGENSAVRAFERLGIAASELRGMDQPLEAIQMRLDAIGNQNEKIAIIRDIFGRTGGKLLNFFENDLASLTRQYEDLGLAVSGEEAARIEKFNDELNILSRRFASVGRNLLIDVTPTALEALQGAQIILEATGAIKARPTAQQQARQRSIELGLREPGGRSLFDVSGNKSPGQSLGEFFGAVISRDATALGAIRPDPNQQQM